MRLLRHGIVLGVLAAGIVVALGHSSVRTARAQANPDPSVRNFYGEADQEVTAVTPVPAGMMCGGLSVGAGLVVQSTEPPGGFTGACLMNRAYYAPPGQEISAAPYLPTVCYSPTGADYSALLPSPNAGSVQCSLPAAAAASSEWHIDVTQNPGQVTRQAMPDSYRVLETCAPRLSAPAPACQQNQNCPCNTIPTSHSCCTHFGTTLVTPDQGKTAVGVAYFTEGTAGSAGDAGSE